MGQWHFGAGDAAEIRSRAANQVAAGLIFGAPQKGRVVKSPASPGGAGIRGKRLLLRSSRRLGCPDAGLHRTDGGYAMPPLATAKCAWQQALIHWRSLIDEGIPVTTRAVPAGGDARVKQAAGGRLGVGRLSLEVGSFPMGWRLMAGKWQLEG